MARLDAVQAGGISVLAFLDMIAVSEGTAGHGDDGYNVLVGGELFPSYGDHPQIFVRINAQLTSSAAGRYQFLARTWDGLVQRLQLSDFGPTNQDLGAIELIRERGALDLVRTGRIEQAVDRCRQEWASLPGAGYGQHENSLSKLMAAFNGALATYQVPHAIH